MNKNAKEKIVRKPLRIKKVANLKNKILANHKKQTRIKSIRQGLTLNIRFLALDINTKKKGGGISKAISFLWKCSFVLDQRSPMTRKCNRSLVILESTIRLLAPSRPWRTNPFYLEGRQRSFLRLAWSAVCGSPREGDFRGGKRREPAEARRDRLLRHSCNFPVVSRLVNSR